MGNAGWGNDPTTPPSTPTLPRRPLAIAHATPDEERRTRLPRHRRRRVPPRSPRCTHRPRGHPLHVGRSGEREWNKVPPAGMVRPRDATGKAGEEAEGRWTKGLKDGATSEDGESVIREVAARTNGCRNRVLRATLTISIGVLFFDRREEARRKAGEEDDCRWKSSGNRVAGVRGSRQRRRAEGDVFGLLKFRARASRESRAAGLPAPSVTRHRNLVYVCHVLQSVSFTACATDRPSDWPVGSEVDGTFAILRLASYDVSRITCSRMLSRFENLG